MDELMAAERVVQWDDAKVDSTAGRLVGEMVASLVVLKAVDLAA